MFFSRRRRLVSKIRQLSTRYEKQIFDLNQLLEISKSLNSTLDYNSLVESILFICMGQLKMLRAGLFARKDVDRQHLYLHRSISGFEMDNSVSYVIPEDHPVMLHFAAHCRAHSYQELVALCPEAGKLPALSSLRPSLVVPLNSRSQINGVLVLDEAISGRVPSPAQCRYVEDIAQLAGIAVHNAFLYEITTTDMMTKLKLRHFLLDHLGDHLDRVRKGAYRLSAIMVDIDHFKNLNDSYGHVCGDTVIRQVAQVLLDNVRQTDIAARYGGEEFVLLLPESSAQDALEIAERIRSVVAASSFCYNGQCLGLTVSLGVAEVLPLLDTNTHAFIDRLDAAMYDSKRRGRDRVSLSPANQ